MLPKLRPTIIRLLNPFAVVARELALFFLLVYLLIIQIISAKCAHFFIDFIFFVVVAVPAEVGVVVGSSKHEAILARFDASWFKFVVIIFLSRLSCVLPASQIIIVPSMSLIETTHI